ncbi:monovalent cation/H+ antiporter complex subunit F [Proteocatella sphenisci]|uniref:monovalent cation/H+ antiporter complex subunit F n=1 Tax=Proteocatella sphenisci TaxID=181070 RepID=UPI0004BBCDDB|nr:monovalent cation/H+ antiporter complex subunit F [Proteocatella sphenisci]
MKTATFILTLLTLISALRILIGPTIWDRLLGLNLVTSKIVIIMIFFASMTQQTYILDTALVYALCSFTGIIFISVYLNRKGRFKEGEDDNND